jgi:hypothetical protein
MRETLVIGVLIAAAVGGPATFVVLCRRRHVRNDGIEDTNRSIRELARPRRVHDGYYRSRNAELTAEPDNDTGSFLAAYREHLRAAGRLG